MCGIAGLISSEDNTQDSAQLIRRMTRSLTHRGPDDEGYFVEGSVALGMRRLKIIDLAGGHQPIFNENGSIALVFNGEIYNYIELREDLLKKGHTFSTNSDTEVIVHAYEEYGADNFLSKFNGMFGLALLDKKKNRLILARDRFGIKPLFYSVTGKKLHFGSEIKAILEDRRVSREMDLSAFNNYLSLNYIPTPLTIYKNIKKLEPAHFLIIDIKTMRIAKKEYWTLKYPEHAKHKTISQYTEEFEEIFKQAVKLRLRSDVPLGVFLSSGIDSTAITAFVSKHFNQHIDTFTMKFEKKSYDESAGAKLVSDLYGTTHHEFESNGDIESIVVDMVKAFDEPMANYGLIPFYEICEYARKFVTVTLSGNGADEIFAGYPTLTAYKIAQLYKKIPGFMRNGIIRPIANSLHSSSERLSFDYKAQQFVNGADFDPAAAHMMWKIIFDDARKTRLLKKEVAAEISGPAPSSFFEEYYKEARTDDPIEKLMYIDLHTFLLDVNIAAADRMSMWHSLENRVPFLDHNLVEFAASVPSSLKLKGFKLKHFLRESVKDLLPDSIVRGSKKGFTPPMPFWLKNKLKFFMLDTLNKKKIDELGYFDYNEVEKTINDHLSGKRENSRELWTLMTFVIWHDLYMK